MADSGPLKELQWCSLHEIFRMHQLTVQAAPHYRLAKESCNVAIRKARKRKPEKPLDNLPDLGFEVYFNLFVTVYLPF